MDPNSTRQQAIGGLLTARALYFFYYMALGSLLPYVSLYYERNGLNGVQIGMLSALSVLVSSPAAFVWSGLADRLKVHRPLLVLSVIAAPVFIWLLARTTTFLLFVPVIAAYALAASAIIPLLDGAALDAARAHGRSYGEVRVGGTLGWIISVVAVGALIQAYDIHWQFYSYIACMALLLVFSLLQRGHGRPLEAAWSANLRGLLSDRSVVVFLISIFIVMVGNGAVQNFFSLYLDNIGASEGLIGMAWAVAAVSEIPVMLLAGRLMRRIGSAGLLRVAFFIYAVRWLLLSFIHDPAWALAAQLLHGLSFGAFLTGGVTYLSERTPAGMTTTAQSIFNVVSYGVAALAGSLIGGYLYDHAGLTVFFRIFSLTAFAGLGLFWFSTGRAWRTAYGTNA